MSDRPVAEVVCRDVLFAHWPIDASHLRPVVPDELTIDTFDGTAWVGALTVDIAEARVQHVPIRPSLFSINLRTYVSLNGEPGVYFISLETDEQFSAWIARNGFGLPYHQAEITFDEHDGTIQVCSQRDSRNNTPARFTATYQPDFGSNPVRAGSGSLEEFLIERTNYYFAGGPKIQQTANMLDTIDSGGVTASHIQASEQPMFAGTAPHDPWSLHPVEASITENTLLDAAGISTPSTEPIYHYCRQQHMTAERIRQVTASEDI